jgi:hypothetical protein
VTDRRGALFVTTCICQAGPRAGESERDMLPRVKEGTRLSPCPPRPARLMVPGHYIRWFTVYSLLVHLTTNSRDYVSMSLTRAIDPHEHSPNNYQSGTMVTGGRAKACSLPLYTQKRLSPCLLILKQ